MIKPELIVPAGNLEKMKTALAFGADAVYLGIPDFSLRVRINDFTLEGIKEAVDYAHNLGKKVYVTTNIFAHNQHLEKLPPYITKLKEFGVDGLFIADPGILSVVKEVWPEAHLSLSTQANCTNWRSAKFWHEQGFVRVVPGRELSLAELQEMKEQVPGLEIECFIHGAMCMAYSGRCFLSKLLTGDREANLGDCAQPCRWAYQIKPLGHEETLELHEEEHGSYLLNSQDMCLLRRLPEMMAVNLHAFKIEGRAKSVYYLANVVGAYRQAIDWIMAGEPDIAAKLEQLYQELETKLYHRGYTDGFMFNQGRLAQNLENSHNNPDWEFCGQVIDSQPHPEQPGHYLVRLKVHNSLKLNDMVEIITPPYDIIKIKATSLLDPEDHSELSEAHGGGGGQEVLLITDRSVPNLSVVRHWLPADQTVAD